MAFDPSLESENFSVLESSSRRYSTKHFIKNAKVLRKNCYKSTSTWESTLTVFARPLMTPPTPEIIIINIISAKELLKLQNQVREGSLIT
jgi:hypothetical protein